MIFDKIEHQKLIAELLNAATYPGHMVELVVEVKCAVANASIKEESPIPA